MEEEWVKEWSFAVLNLQNNLDHILEQMEDHQLEQSISTPSTGGAGAGGVAHHSSAESTAPFFRLGSGHFNTHVDETGRQATRLWCPHYHCCCSLPHHFHHKFCGHIDLAFMYTAAFVLPRHSRSIFWCKCRILLLTPFSSIHIHGASLPQCRIFTSSSYDSISKAQHGYGSSSSDGRNWERRKYERPHSFLSVRQRHMALAQNVLTAPWSVWNNSPIHGAFLFLSAWFVLLLLPHCLCTTMAVLPHNLYGITP